jgi:hypothetical protein
MRRPGDARDDLTTGDFEHDQEVAGGGDPTGPGRLGMRLEIRWSGLWGFDKDRRPDQAVWSGLGMLRRPDRPKTKTVVWSRSWGGLGQTRPMDVVMVVVVVVASELDDKAVKHTLAIREGARC